MLSRKVEKKKQILSVKIDEIWSNLYAKMGLPWQYQMGKQNSWYLKISVKDEWTAIQHHRVNLLKDMDPDLLAHPLEGYDVVKPLF